MQQITVIILVTLLISY